MNAVTGALSYTGRAIAEELLAVDEAVRRTIMLFEAARRAGVRRVVHISVSGADVADDLPYFRGKHRVVGAETGSTQDAAGPEVHELRRLVELIAQAIGSRARIVAGPRPLALAAVRVGNALLRDVVVTRDELSGLARSLLTSTSPPRGRDSFSTWLAENAPVLGRRYQSELRRNFRGQE